MENHKLISHFEEVEKVGLEIQRKRKDIVAFDSQRQSSREAARSLSKTEDKSVWCCVGQTFLKLPAKNVETRLKTDVEKLSHQIDATNKSLKNDVKTLNDIDQTAPVKGFDLEAVNSNRSN